MVDSLAAHQLVAIALIFSLAGFVKGVLGLGLPTLAMGLLGTFLSPADAASLLIVPSLVTNVWQLWFGPSFLPLLRRLWPMLAGIGVGTWSGAGLLTRGDTGPTAMALGLVLAAYAIVGLTTSTARLELPRPWEPWLAPLVGALTGLVTAATGVFVIPAVPYLQSLGLGKDALVQALGLSFTASTLALAGGLVGDGALTTTLATASLSAVLPSLGGMAIGQLTRGHLPPERFRRWFYFALFVLGSYMAARSAV